DLIKVARQQMISSAFVTANLPRPQQLATRLVELQSIHQFEPRLTHRASIFPARRSGKSPRKLTRQPCFARSIPLVLRSESPGNTAVAPAETQCRHRGTPWKFPQSCERLSPSPAIAP